MKIPFRFALVLLLAAAGLGYAQTTTTPVVSVFAPDSAASEFGPDPGLFVIERRGETNSSFRVFFSLRGTASNGVDYAAIEQSVEVPSGVSRVPLKVLPIDDSLPETVETVNLRLEPSLIMAPIDPYRIGSPSNAVVNIADNDRFDTNRTVVNITATDAVGSEIPEVPPDMERPQLYDPAVFTVTRSGPTNIPLVVYYQVGGTASNGVDYAKLSGEVTVPAGSRSAQIEVSVIDDTLIEGPESVIVWLQEPVCVAIAPPPPECYVLGLNREAHAGIRDDEIPQTEVNIFTVDADAAEQDPRLDSLPNTGLLRITRSGPTNFPLTVYYQLSGTASNGVDYVKLSGSVVISENARSAELLIEAVDDKLAESTESLQVTIQPPMCAGIYPPPPDCYVVGRSSRATAYILDNEVTSSAPSVSITRPVSGSTFPPGSDIRIEATTIDRDGYAPHVEFFANSNKIGDVVINFLVAPPPGQPIHFTFDWRDVRAGSYVLTARATDDSGLSSVSAPVRISVTDSNRPPQTNIISIVAIDAYASETSTAIWGTNSTDLIYTNRLGYTNTAVFAVRREGPTNTAVLVQYEIGGTASNGVDYAKLSGSVEIPAGQRAERIVIVPVDDAIAEPLESVILALQPSSSFILGYNRKAAATIADNDYTRPRTYCLGDRLFQLCHPATNGYCYRVDASTDLRTWIPLCTNRVVDASVHYVDPDAPSLPVRFYRVLPAECPTEE
jgi:hypothetical protein